MAVVHVKAISLRVFSSMDFTLKTQQLISTHESCRRHFIEWDFGSAIYDMFSACEKYFIFITQYVLHLSYISGLLFYAYQKFSKLGGSHNNAPFSVLLPQGEKKHHEHRWAHSASIKINRRFVCSSQGKDKTIFMKTKMAYKMIELLMWLPYLIVAHADSFFSWIFGIKG